MLQVNLQHNFFMFTQKALGAALILVLTANQKIAIDQLVDEAILVHRARFLEYHYFFCFV